MWNSRTFKFTPNSEKKREKLCEEILKILKTDITVSCKVTCLETLRILSRDKAVLAPVTTRHGMLVLVRLALLEYTGIPLQELLDVPVIVEAVKCLCNIVFHSEAAQQISVELKLVDQLCERLKLHKDQNLIHEIKFFDLRLLFLFSALRADIRAQLCHELHGLELLIEVLERTLSLKWLDRYEVATDPNGPLLPLQETDRVSEVLKAIFNVTLDSHQDLKKEDAHQFRYITAILRYCLMIKSQTEDKTEELHSHSINLLSNVPASCLDVMMSTKFQTGSIEYNGKNMDTIQVLLEFMEKRIDKGSCLKEGLTPVLSLMTEGSRVHSDMRKYIKAKILPPLKDVKNRPEVGTMVRNKLVRLMTHVDLGVKQTAAEFLFVLCKEKVDSLLKYTGYGNAAGLLVARGLLAGGRGEGQYSEDEDSDTEEYKSAKPFINPITGHIEEPMPNPFDEMTEEQKEYEAMKLANMFEKLSKEQIIKPMGVKPDGTIAPLEETVHQYKTSDQCSDTDSD
nr:PREDICTED: synembryn-B isoform X2 [Latimeria chalumnae]|eukprot:XP_014340978.1 PREDICTED: synembryn-B isoform X2 [Latimeria chalumnae]